MQLEAALDVWEAEEQREQQQAAHQTSRESQQFGEQTGSITSGCCGSGLGCRISRKVAVTLPELSLLYQ